MGLGGGFLCVLRVLHTVWRGKIISLNNPVIVNLFMSLAHVGKLPVTWGKAVIFGGYSNFLHYLQTATYNADIQLH